MKRLSRANLWWTTIALLLAGSGVARAATTITIDASKQTTGNPHFWSNAVGTGTAALTLRSDLESHYKIGNREAGFQHVRGHGVLSDAMGIYKGPGMYSWTNFDKYLTSIAQAGMRPIMEMDFMPTALASNGNDKNTFKNATDYKNFIAAVAQHCVDKFGMDDVAKWYWEIWNEPDYSGFWTGTMADYYTLYDTAVAAITSVIPNALVGGPATTQEGPIGAFLQHCKSAGTRVTFASSHKYPGGSNTGTTADANNFVTENNNRVNAITSAGYKTSDVLSFNTEWNSSYSGQGGNPGDAVMSMDNHWNVGFILKSAKLLSDKDSGETPPRDRVLVLGALGRVRRVRRPLGLVHPGQEQRPASVRAGLRPDDLSGDPQGRLQRLQDAELHRPEALDVERRDQQRRRGRDGHDVDGWR